MIHVNEGDVHRRLLPNHPGNAGQKVATSNFVIIESTSANAGHNMDARWLSVVTGMGHTGSIMPQTTLDNTAFFASANALIVSSGVIALTPLRVTTIRQFLQTGKPVFIQGEYLTSYTSNQAFQTIITATGGTYALGATVSGDLQPCSILNAYATTTNSVPTIGYHWYGSTGSGCNNLEYFMRYSGNNLGFVYCPTNLSWGDMIQSTDQDWVRALTSPALMQNIIYAMLSGNACSVVCGTVLQAQHMELHGQPLSDGRVALTWSLDGDAQPGQFRIECNGTEIGVMDVLEAGGMVFEFNDLRMPTGVLEYRVRHVDRNGNETMSGTTIVDLGAATPQLRVATEQNGFRIWSSDGATLAQVKLMSLDGRRVSAEVIVLPSTQDKLPAMSGIPAGVYILEVRTLAGNAIQRKVVWMP